MWEPLHVIKVLHLLRSSNDLSPCSGLYSQSYLHPPKISLLPPPEVTRVRCLVNQDKKPRPVQRKPTFLMKLRGKDGGKKEEPLRNAYFTSMDLLVATFKFYCIESIAEIWAFASGSCLCQRFFTTTMTLSYLIICLIGRKSDRKIREIMKGRNLTINFDIVE